MATLTKAQQLARDHLEGDVLIAAGAGSGKTKVLTERVVKLLVDHQVPLQSLLLITFTNAAAGEMKARVRKALLEGKREDLASQVDEAFIMTFDAFALYLVQKYSHLLHLSQDVGVFEETLYGIEKQATLETLFLEGYETKDPAFIQLIKTFVVNNDDALKEFILRIDAKADLMVDKLDYYRTYIKTHFAPSWQEEKRASLFTYYKRQIALVQHLSTKFESAEQTELFYQETSRLIAIPQLDDLLIALSQLSFPKLKPRSISEEDKELRERLKKDLLSLKADADMVPIDRQMGYYEETQTHVQVILDLLLELNRRLDHQKQQKQQFPFADIGKMALTILNDSATLKSVRDQFQYIMVDEYQDTNDLQEALLTKIGQRNLFMVGDVKQSIYRFRNANSEIFNRKFLTYQPYESVEDKHQTKIILAENFRSRQEVLAAINDIFKHLMKKELGGITYNHEQALNFGQQSYQDLKSENLSYELEIVRYEKTEKDPEVNEPELIAQDILKKIEQGVEVADLTTQSKRKASFKDFTILIDRKSNFEAYIKTFNQYGIPLEVFAERDLSDSDFYRVLKNLMVLMVHHQGEDMVKGFEQAYLSVLRSFIYQTKDADLYAFMHGKKSFKETALFALLKTYIPLAQQLDLATWMQRLFQALKLEQALLALPDLPSNLARLEGWLKHVQHLSGLGYTLKDYLNFLKQAQSLDVDLTIQASKQSDDAVQLMTIHKSKGLEFPFVYYPGLTKGFNMVETKGYYQFSKTYGIQLPYPEAVYVRPIFADLILQEEQDAIIAEQIRLWYVALTRAKEKIILILESSQPKTIVDLERARCFADFMQIYLQQQVNIPIQIEVGQFPISLPPLPSVNKVIKDASVKFEFHPQPFTVITPKRASKLLPDQVDEAALAYGTYLHECLFLLDFKTMDVRFIPNEKDRHLIAKIVAMPIFQQWQREAMDNKITVLKEYGYLDPSTNQTSVIDLLVIQGDKVTILDYKTNDIDDLLYETQVITYATYMKQQGFHVQSLWLLSLVQGKLKKVNFPQS